MQHCNEPTIQTFLTSIALARIILPSEISIQAPPNLSNEHTEKLIQAGINDFGGISPLTEDFINPGYAWPHIERLKQLCKKSGFILKPRLPIYNSFINKKGFLTKDLHSHIQNNHANIT